MRVVRGGEMGGVGWCEGWGDGKVWGDGRGD